MKLIYYKDTHRGEIYLEQIVEMGIIFDRFVTMFFNLDLKEFNYDNHDAYEILCGESTIGYVDKKDVTIKESEVK